MFQSSTDLASCDKLIIELFFMTDSQLLVTASDDGHLKIYDVARANLAGTLYGHGSWVRPIYECNLSCYLSIYILGVKAKMSFIV